MATTKGLRKEELDKNKSEAIRRYHRQHPEAKPRHIVAALDKEGIQVSSAFVSTTLYKVRVGGRPTVGKSRGVITKLSGKKPVPGVDLHQLKQALVLISNCRTMAEADRVWAAAKELAAHMKKL